MLTVDHYELIRRRVLIEGQSVRGVALELGHSRRTVDKALKHSTPPGYVMKAVRRRPVSEAIEAVILGILEADRDAPAKQRHSGTRIHQRLVEEHGFAGSAATVRRCVRRLDQKRRVQDVPLVLSFEPGQEAQVDWGEAQVIENGMETRVYLFEMRLSYSKASFARAYRRMTQEAFLDGHVRAFEYFGAVPRRLAYDNLKAAVVQINGRERRLTQGFVQMRSHYLFESRFCNVACGNEKGDVENLVKRSKGTYLTPVPQVNDLEEVSRLLLEGCRRDLSRIDRGQEKTRRELLEQERAKMLPLPPDRFVACVQRMGRSSKQALVRFEDNDYSVPAELACRPCVVRAFAEAVVIVCEHREVASHRRCYERGQCIMEPVHYLGVLERKPGALDDALAFKSMLKDQDLQLLRRELRYRHGESGDKQFIAILLLRREHDAQSFARAVTQCVSQRLFAVDAVRQALGAQALAPAAALLDLSQRPQLRIATSGQRPVAVYGSLLSGAVEDGGRAWAMREEVCS